MLSSNSRMPGTPVPAYTGGSAGLPSALIPSEYLLVSGLTVYSLLVMLMSGA